VGSKLHEDLTDKFGRPTDFGTTGTDRQTRAAARTGTTRLPIFDWLGIRAGNAKYSGVCTTVQNDVDSGAGCRFLLTQSVSRSQSRVLSRRGRRDVRRSAAPATRSLEYRAYGGRFHQDADASPARGLSRLPYETWAAASCAPDDAGADWAAARQAVRNRCLYAADPKQA